MRNEEKRAHGIRRAAASAAVRAGGLDPRQRLRRQDLRSFVGMAAVEGHPARYAGSGPDLQAQDVAVLGDLAHARGRRRFIAWCSSTASDCPRPGQFSSRARGIVLSWRLARRDGLGSVALPGASRRLTRWSRTAAPGSPRRRRRSVRRLRFKGALSTRFARVRRRDDNEAGKLQAWGRSRTCRRRDCISSISHQADWRVERYMQWCEFWADLLGETSIAGGRRVYAHGRIREARSGLTRLVSKGVLFTYLCPGLTPKARCRR